MVERGGGYRGLNLRREEQFLIISLDINVCDSMGANTVNTVVEDIKKYIEELCNLKALMSIVTNSSNKRKAGASFRVNSSYFHNKDLPGEVVSKRIVEANTLAKCVPERAVTHNKGIMNGISGLALATSNDTRAIEASAHFYAQESGKYQALTDYNVEDGFLQGTLSLPLALGTVGGSTNSWPPSALALRVLNNPSALELNRIAVALGLAQNVAALYALVTEGIQKGHMKLHRKKAFSHLTGS